MVTHTQWSGGYHTHPVIWWLHTPSDLVVTHTQWSGGYTHPVIWWLHTHPVIWWYHTHPVIWWLPGDLCYHTHPDHWVCYHTHQIIWVCVVHTPSDLGHGYTHQITGWSVWLHTPRSHHTHPVIWWYHTHPVIWWSPHTPSDLVVTTHTHWWLPHPVIWWSPHTPRSGGHHTHPVICGYTTQWSLGDLCHHTHHCDLCGYHTHQIIWWSPHTPCDLVVTTHRWSGGHHTHPVIWCVTTTPTGSVWLPHTSSDLCGYHTHPDDLVGDLVVTTTHHTHPVICVVHTPIWWLPHTPSGGTHTPIWWSPHTPCDLVVIWWSPHTPCGGTHTPHTQWSGGDLVGGGYHTHPDHWWLPHPVIWWLPPHHCDLCGNHTHP